MLIAQTSPQIDVLTVLWSIASAVPWWGWVFIVIAAAIGVHERSKT